MAEDGVRLTLRACVCDGASAECWAEWGSEGVLIDFGHTSLLLKIPWLLLFCSPSPSFCLASSNETPNELEHVLTALSLFCSLTGPLSLSTALSLAFPLHIFVSLPLALPADFSIAPLPPLPLFFSLCLSFFISWSRTLYHLCHTFSLCALLAYFIGLSVDQFPCPSHLLLSPLSSSPPGLSHLSFPPLSSSTQEEGNVRWRCCLPAAAESILIEWLRHMTHSNGLIALQQSLCPFILGLILEDCFSPSILAFP